MDGREGMIVSYQFQSTLPRGERLSYTGMQILSPAVSIHAPARGATDQTLDKQVRGLVSIHAPARGATPSCACGPFFNHRQFQSTLPRGERQQPFRRFNAPLHVSIHAPARGATSRFILAVLTETCFNPRSREGSDRARLTRTTIGDEFQSTLPRGERLGVG